MRSGVDKERRTGFRGKERRGVEETGFGDGRRLRGVMGETFRLRVIVGGGNGRIVVRML